MSLSRSLFLGPYAQCTYVPKRRDVSITSCTNTKCANHGEHAIVKFCPLCGTKSGLVKVEEDVVPDPLSITSEDALESLQGEELHSDEEPEPVHFLGPNQPGPRDFYLGEEAVHDDFTDLDRAAEMAWFEKKYARELNKLRKVYASVEIRWGAHQYFR